MGDSKPDIPNHVPMHSSRRFNQIIPATGVQRYLEIGVETGGTFFNVDVPYKVAVDPNFRFDFASYQSEDVEFNQVTSDEFFLRRAGDRKFDMIFLDGLHTFEQTFRDFCNSIAHSHDRTLWVIDDTVPRDVYSAISDHQAALQARRQAGAEGSAWHGDVYKVIFAIHDFFPVYSFCTVVGNGNPQTFVWKQPRADFAPAWNNLEAITRLDYFDFLREKRFLNLVSEEEGIDQVVSMLGDRGVAAP
jgi:hypothetical protein